MPEGMGTLLLLRHGQARYGEADYDRLSSRGEEQARHLGRHLAATGPLTAFFTGPLRRQMETGAYAAEAAAEAGTPLPIATILTELAEYPAFELLRHFIPRLVDEDPGYAALTGAPSHALLDRAFRTILVRWARDEWTVAGVERVTDFTARVRGGLEKVLAAAGRGARLAVVTSAGPIGAALQLALGGDHERMIRTSTVVHNASITEFRFRGQEFAWKPEQFSLHGFNHTGHLPSEIQTDR
jgi:broad specificity phosphatase PhoE